MKSSKEIICDAFCNTLSNYRISFKRHNLYHVQIQGVHNFYPSKGTYYNSDTEHKCKFPEFKSHDDVVKFLRENGSGEMDMTITYPAYKVVEILADCEDLEEAKEFFRNH